MIESVKYTLESTIDSSERELFQIDEDLERMERCLLYTSPSPRD